MVRSMTIDEAALQKLIGFRDDLGVLSFYAGFTPDQAADPQPTTPIEIRNRIRDLRQRMRDEGPEERAKAVEHRLERLDDHIDWLVDPKEHGRGRALFVGVEGGDTERIALQIPFQERVIYHDSPFVRPLVAAWDEGRAAGILVVHRAGTRLLEWRIGEAEEIDTSALELGDAQLADVKSGPSGGSPQRGSGGIRHREQFEDRIDENLRRLLRRVATDAGTEAGKRNWDRLVVAGAPKARHEMLEVLRDVTGVRVLESDHAWDETPAHQIADEAWPLLRSVHRDREHELVAMAKDRALSGGAGALGLRNVLKALNEGRVEHLLFDTAAELSGYRSSEDTLHAEVGGPEAQAGFEMHRESLLVEQMVEKTMRMSGQVTPLDESAAEALVEHGGMAALLRW